jgi:hypothetical protein
MSGVYVRTSSPNLPLLARWALCAFALLLISLGLAWLSSGFHQIGDWLSFLAVAILASGLLWGGWIALRAVEKPGLPAWLGWLLVGAALLRLAAGAIWFVALPSGGHGSPPELAGYVMADAYQRDQAAWKLAQSQKSLLNAFQGNFRKADQYGGMLFLSALIYRYLGGETHQPLLMVLVTAAFSALAVVLTWALARRTWNERAAKLAAWGFALYPEAVLLGSSQMREAFTITLTAAAFYGLVLYVRQRSRAGLIWTFASLLFYLPFSPPFTALLVVMLAITALLSPGWLFRGDRPPRRFWLILGALVLLILVVTWLSLSQFAPPKVSNPLALLGWWAKKTAEYQAHLTKSASGWVQKIFRSTPDWTHIYLLVGYGVVQPFLPAALVVGSEAPVMPWITLWRSLGWTLLLLLLVYAPLHAFRKNGDPTARAFSLVTWLWVLIASYRGGGDQWDNPRYRAALAAVQVALAAWAWTASRRAEDPWFRRVLMGLGFVFAWFLPWYLQREFHFPWPVGDPFKSLGLGVACALLFIIWDWARTNRLS